MATCDACGKSENMPYHCRHCGGTFCGEHRLPESHDCPGLENWNDPSGIFESDFDDSVDNPGTRSSDSVFSRVFNTGTGGPLGYFRGNMTYVFLGVMFLTFAAQWLVTLTFGNELHSTLFVLRSDRIEYVWTWVTSVFSHSRASFFHILFNGIVLYFFGPPVERAIGSKRFVALFLVSGAVAGLAQVGTVAVMGGVSGVLGASGAIMAVMAVLTVLNPDLRVMLIFPPIPLPIWVLTAGYALLSVVGALGGPSLGNVANLAHLGGLVIGYLYGQRVKRQGVNGPANLQFGGRGGGGMGGRGRGPF